MNILILNWRDPLHPLAGGAEISLLEHAKYWNKQGANVTWFASSFSGAQKEEVFNEIKIIRRGSHFTVHIMFFLHWLRYKVDDYDVIIDCFHFLPFFTPLFLKRKKIIAFIHEVAGKVWYLNLYYPLAWVGYHLEPYFFLFYKQIPFITPSESAKTDLIKLGIPKKNIFVIHNGVNLEKVNISTIKEKVPTILFLNRISKDKGIEDALLAFIEIKKIISEVKLWIVGKEESEGQLKKLIEKIGISKKINSSIMYFGFVDQKKKFELLKKAWILVHPSKKEGWGLTVIEAASQGTPAVGYDVEGLRDSIKNNKTGLLTKENFIDLAKGLERLIRDKKLYSQMSKEAMEWSRKFNWNISGEKSWKLIKLIYER